MKNMKRWMVASMLLATLLTAGVTTASAARPAVETTAVAAQEKSIDMKGAVKAFQKKYPGISITQIQYENKKGNYYYEVQGMDEKNIYKLEIYTNGTVKNVFQKSHYGKKAPYIQYKKFELSDVTIGEKKATNIALKAVGGKGVVEEFELEKDNGGLQYEFSIRVGRKDWDVTVDATTGTVLEIDD